MIIILKNGKKIDLKYNFLFLEYLEEYPGGFKELKKDMDTKHNLMKLHNHLLYSILRCNMDEVLTYREAISLIQTKDMERIINFVSEEIKKMDEFKKKDVRSIQKKKKKK